MTENLAEAVIKGNPAMPRCGARCLHHQGHDGPCDMVQEGHPRWKDAKSYWTKWVIAQVKALKRKPGRRPNGKLCESRTVSEIAEQAGYSRRTVYDLLDKEKGIGRKPRKTDKAKLAVQQVNRTVRSLRQACNPDLWRKYLADNKPALEMIWGALRAAQKALPPEPGVTTEAAKLAQVEPSGPATSEPERGKDAVKATDRAD